MLINSLRNATRNPKPVLIGLVSDFNARNLAVLLRKNATTPKVECIEAPYGQMMEHLLNQESDFWMAAYDALVIWSSPERVSKQFQNVVSYQEFSLDELFAEVDQFAHSIQQLPKTIRNIFVPSWTVSTFERGLGPRDFASQGGIANTLMRMNLRLIERFENDPRMILLDAQRWLCQTGAPAFSPKLWHMAKTPFDVSVFQEASKDILAALDGVAGRSKKIVILDLDNTLWSGIVGDVGWEKLRLGGHDPVGEAFVDFQHKLCRLSRRGILLAVASKNEESIALEAIRKHPNMILRPEDFVAWRINWDDKAKNISEIMGELNLGLDSAVFLDDSPFERARVREALPEVFVPDLPTEPLEYASWLSRLRCFDTPHITAEDKARSRMYVADRERKLLQKEVASLSDWLASLELTVQSEELNAQNLERASQLFNKTNQMNLSTRRLAASELVAWAGEANHVIWTFRVSDKFGDYGLCGIASMRWAYGRATLVDFLLSCRVMGRGVEEAMLATAVEYARSVGSTELQAEYIPTAKNQPCAAWFEKHSGFRREENKFRLSLSTPFQAPSHIRSVRITREAVTAQALS